MGLGGEQRLRIGMLRVGEHAAVRPASTISPWCITITSSAMRAHDVEVVGDEQHRHAELRLQVLEAASRICACTVTSRAVVGSSVACCVVRPGWRRLSFSVLLVALGVLSTALSALLSWGPNHAWSWLDSPTQLALLGVLLILPWLTRVSVAVLVFLMVLSLGVLLGVLNRAPSSPYFALTLQDWEQGRFIRFHGLAQWLGWVWPFAALVYGVALRWSGSTKTKNPGMTSSTPAPTTAPSSYYERHVFICTNQRPNGESCCAQFQAQAAFDHCKSQVRAAGLAGPGKVRVNRGRMFGSLRCRPGHGDLSGSRLVQLC